MERVDRGMGRSSSLGSLSGRSLHKSTRHRRDEGPRSCDSTAKYACYDDSKSVKVR